MTRWKCEKCGYIYDEDIGDSAHGITGGTKFEKLPDSWICPRCGAPKSRFAMK